MSALRPNAAAVPCTRLELLTPSAVHLPRRRPPASVFLVTTAKSGPGIRTRTTAKARNSAYFDHDILPRYPWYRWCSPGAGSLGPGVRNGGRGGVGVERGALGA